MDEVNPRHPGSILKEEFLDPLDISPYRLARSIGVHVRRVSELIKGHRRLTPDTALRLGLFFGVPARWWLDMQSEYDIAQSEDLESLREVVRPYVRPADILISRAGARKLEPTSRPTDARPVAAVSEDFLEKLRSKALASRATPSREAKTIIYANGATALVGVER